MKHIPLHSLEHLSDGTSEDDIINRLDAQGEIHDVFSSDYLTDQQKIVLALSHDVFPVELKGVRVRTWNGPRSIGEIANSMPQKSNRVSLTDIGKGMELSRGRAHVIAKEARLAAGGLINRQRRVANSGKSH